MIFCIYFSSCRY